MNAMLQSPALGDPWLLLIDGLHCRRLATRLAPRLTNHIKRCAERFDRIVEVENLLTAESTSVLHHLYKCNSSRVEIDNTCASPTYQHEPSGYSLHVCSVVHPDLRTVDIRAALDACGLRRRYPMILRALELLLCSSGSYLFTHAIDVLCVTEAFQGQNEAAVYFPGTLLCAALECPIEQLEHLFAGAVSHWLTHLSLAENRDRVALYAETASTSVIPQTRWSTSLLLLCKIALTSSFMLRCIHEMSEAGHFSMAERSLIGKTAKKLKSQMKVLVPRIYAREHLLSKGPARDFVMTNVLGARQRECSVEALYQ